MSLAKNTKHQIPNPKRIVFIVGPTAIGKTQVASVLARKIKAEIISCDSMQVYKGMSIITSKPPAKLRKSIRHYLIDIVGPNQEYDVLQYRKLALKKLRAVLKKGKMPLFVGGSGLYMSVLIDGIFEAKTQDACLRKKLYAQAEKKGSHYLHNKLKGVDLEAAKKIHPNDVKRIIRALEVFEATGRPISYLQQQRHGLSDEYDVKIFCLNMERQALYRKIGERVERMFAKGLVQEVKALIKLKLSRTASCAIGIKELKGYFYGEYDLQEAKRLIERNTRLYARRQLTWFRKDKRIKWINVGTNEKPNEVADRIYSIQGRSLKYHPFAL